MKKTNMEANQLTDYRNYCLKSLQIKIILMINHKLPYMNTGFPDWCHWQK